MTSPSFAVSWSGSDGPGPGISNYNVYVSDNGGAYTLWQSVTTATSATFAGQAGNTYGFYSIATDNVGLTQPTPTGAQATTQVISPATIQFAVSQLTANVTQGTASVVIDRVGNLGASVTIDISSPGAPDVAAFNKAISFGPNVTSQAVTIPIINDGQSGESDESVPLTLSSPGTGATLGATSSSTLVIHDDNLQPTPLVTVQSLLLEKIKVGKRKNAKKETVLVLQLSGALNAAAADNANAYELAPVITVKATGKGKHKKPPTTKLGTPVTPAKAVYTASNNQVTVTPRGTLNLTKPEELIVDAALVTDTLGRQIDGTDDGQPGGDYIATINGNRVNTGGLPLARKRQQPAVVPAAIDALLARGELADLKRAVGIRHERHHLE